MSDSLKKHLFDIIKAVVGAALAAGMAELLRQFGNIDFQHMTAAASMLGAVAGVKLFT